MPLMIWWRKTWWLFPSALAIMFLVMRNVQPVEGINPGWSVNWGWMLGVWNGGTLLLSPFMAACAARVMIRDWPHGLREQIAVLPRGRSSSRHIFAVLYLQGLAAMLTAIGVAAVLCAWRGAPIESATLPWQLFTGPAALFAAVALGMAVGTLFGNLIAIPLLGFGVFLAHQLFFWSGFPELFTPEIPTWFYEDARPKTTHLMATVALNLVVGTGLWIFLNWLTRLPRMRPALLLVGCALCLSAALAIYLPWVIAGNMDTYERIG